MAKARKKATAKAILARDKGLIQLNVFDGTRELFPNGVNLLIRISDGSQQQLVDDFFKKSSIQFSVPFSDNFKDNYTLLVSCDGYRDAGFFHPPLTISRRNGANAHHKQQGVCIHCGACCMCCPQGKRWKTKGSP